MIDWVHHVGQKEDVNVVQSVVKNSIEERILRLQARRMERLRATGGRRKEPTSSWSRFMDQVLDLGFMVHRRKWTSHFLLD